MRLREWQYMSKPGTKTGSTSATASSKTNKEKFADLVDYMIKCKPGYTTDTYVNRLNDTGFEYEEHRALGDIELDYDIRVEVDLSKNDLFTVHVFKDDMQIESLMPKGWEDLLRYLKIYFSVPPFGSQEYISLTEASVIAGDFELYENLWEDVNEEQTKKDRAEAVLAKAEAAVKAIKDIKVKSSGQVTKSTDGKFYKALECEYDFDEAAGYKAVASDIKKLESTIRNTIWELGASASFKKANKWHNITITLYADAA